LDSLHLLLEGIAKQASPIPIREEGMKTLTLMLMLLVMVGVPLPAYAADVSSIVLSGYGIIEDKEVEKTVKAPGTILGHVTLMKDAVLVSQTNRIPASKGTHFGIFYSVMGRPSGATVPLTVKILTPGLKMPEAERVQYVEQWEATPEIGEKKHWAIYAFEHDWELVPGIWTFQLFYNNRKLAEKRFEVYKP
jgi:hypothetical protein